MVDLKVAILGDVVGRAGRRVVQQQLPRLIEDYAPDLIIANGENARSGSGLSPEHFRRLQEWGVDAVTLGDHVFRDRRIVDLLQDPTMPVARPANLATRAPGKRMIRLEPRPGFRRPIVVITVLGRVFFPLPANDPFECVDSLLTTLPPDAVVIVEAHMEATSEKVALAMHLAGRVAVVFGTHTHVPTADARVLAGGTAFITDLGMCGPYDSIIGREAEAVLRHMTAAQHVQYPVATDGAALCGAVVHIDESTRQARDITRVEYPADYHAAPFA